MNEIKCLDNYCRLREMFLRGETGDIDYFTNRLGIKKRTFYRLIKYLEIIDGIKVLYNKRLQIYYICELRVEK
jgi:hypothetical protein